MRAVVQRVDSAAVEVEGACRQCWQGPFSTAGGREGRYRQGFGVFA